MQNTEDIKKKRHIAKNFDENQQCVQIVGKKNLTFLLYRICK